MKSTSQHLVAELARIHSNQDTTNFGVLDYLYAFGSPIEAMAYAKLFWPDFLVVEGMVIRADVIEDEADLNRIREVLQQWNGDIAKTECSFNRFEVPCGAFGKRAGEGSPELGNELAQTLVEMWRARLSQLYPERTFSVFLEHEPASNTCITFCQEEKRKRTDKDRHNDLPP